MSGVPAPVPSSSAPALQISGLGKSFGAVEAIRNAARTCPRGEVMRHGRTVANFRTAALDSARLGAAITGAA